MSSGDSAKVKKASSGGKSSKKPDSITKFDFLLFKICVTHLIIITINTQMKIKNKFSQLCSVLVKLPNHLGCS